MLMGLPTILDVVISLVFIYLALSLIASEIQELISTLLQWRAEHLKKAIEILLIGGSLDANGKGSQVAQQTTADLKKVRKLANQLYNNPLIESLNQESKAILSGLPRLFAKTIYRSGTLKEDSLFGKKVSGPSYIDSTSFATTLLETIEFSTIRRQMASDNLIQFIEETIFDEIDKLVIRKTENREFIRESYERLKKTTQTICEDFRDDKTGLIPSFDRLEQRVNLFFNKVKQDLEADTELSPEEKHLLAQIDNYRQDILGKVPDSKQPEVPSRIYPSLVEMVGYYSKAIAEQELDLPEWSANKAEKIKKAAQWLPPSLSKSLEVLARRTQAEIDRIDESLSEFNQEIGHWFDRSMERSRGVYKRNAKAVALLIGLAISLAVNADTLYIIGRFSQDDALRGALVARVQNLESQNQSLEAIAQQIKTSLDELPLPLGWQRSNRRLQWEHRALWLGDSPADKSDRFNYIGWFLQGCGYILSAIAISMGASFWFDALNRIVNVRKTGTPATEKK